MAQYRVTTKSFIDNAIREADDIIEYTGIPHDNLEPLDKAAEKAVKTYENSDSVDINRQYVAAQTGDPETVIPSPESAQLV